LVYLNRLMDNVKTYPFINEGDETISFRFACGQVLHHTGITAPKIKNPKVKTIQLQ